MRFLEGKGVKVWGLQGLKGLLDIGLAVFVISKSGCRLLAYFSHVYIYRLNEERLLTHYMHSGACFGAGRVSLAATYLKVPREHEALRAAYQVLLTLPVTSTGILMSNERFRSSL